MGLKRDLIFLFYRYSIPTGTPSRDIKKMAFSAVGTLYR